MGTCTRTLSFLDASLRQPAGITAPTDGIVTSWRVRVGTTSAPMRLRAATMGAGTLYTGGNASGTVAPATNAVSPFATRFPIKAGEQIGLELDGAAMVLNDIAAGTLGGHWVAFQGLTAGVGTAGTYAGNTPATFAGSSGSELLVNATIEADSDGDGFGDESQDQCLGRVGPSNGCANNTFTLGKLKLNKKKGTATLSVGVPGPGNLTASGKTIKNAKATAKNAGAIKLTIKAKGKAAKALRKKGKAKASITVSFTPTGGIVNSQGKSVTLKKKR